MKHTSSTSLVTWHWHSFESLDHAKLYALLQLRQDVFVLEQSCLFRDIDGLDPHCTHGLGFSAQGELRACARIAPPGSCFDDPCIGRVIVHPAWRGNGHGRRLIQESIYQAQRRYPQHTLRISAQAHLETFYAEFGFVRQGEYYDEAGIPHCEMALNPSQVLNPHKNATTCITINL